MSTELFSIYSRHSTFHEFDDISPPFLPHPSQTQVPESAAEVRRHPPLSTTDEDGNHRVTEVSFRNQKQSGKYTGWMDQDNRPNGNGVFRVANGDVYEGEWKHGQQHGHGVYTWSEGDLYTGSWDDGKPHGRGVFVYSNGRIYDGFFARGSRQGMGVFTWPNGAKYEGEYRMDKRNGTGFFVYADGRAYKGQYQDDRPHGHGIEYTKDGGVLYDGMWELGEFEIRD